jgi:type IV secretion system protein VirB5
MRRRAGLVTAIGTAVLAAVAVAPQAQAQFAVIDVAAIRHLVVQIDYWRQQIEAMSAELTQLEATHAALTGPRGMEALLAITPEQRNYLPGEWEAMRAALEGQSAEYGALARAVGAVVELRAVLSEAVLAEMTEAEREQLIEARQTAAGLVVMTRQAYAEASARFGSLAQLVAAIGGALDAKAVADLQARIGVEQAMLANEQAKLAVLYQMIEAERWVQGQQLKELGIAAHGRFDERFRPTLP